ncbi:MAG: SGNH/GDSL hydrolase family protein, partial [Ignavibacteriaceae bacterium]
MLTVGSMILFFSILEIGTRLFWRVEVQKAHVGIIAKEGNQEIALEGELYKTNSHGLRNKELQTEKVASAERRILALGDSFIWGDGLPEEDLVTVKIDSLLNKQSHQKVEVINAGISGFNTIDEFQQLVRLTPEYKPDLAMVFFFTNDVLA